MAYFERLGPDSFRPTGHVSGAWDIATQHIGPALGLLVHQIQQDLATRRVDSLQISRLAYEILGVIPMDVVDTTIEVIRAGRTIELVEATYGHGGRTGIRVRAWLQQTRDTGTISGGALEPLPSPEEMPRWDPTTVWGGGYLASAQVRRIEEAPGHSRYWVRTDVPLLEGEPVSDLARAAALYDIANGMAIRADPAQVHFPNIDLTAHLVRSPRGPWVGFETRVTFGPSGLGLTSSVIHDLDGPVGTVAQSLTVRP